MTAVVDALRALLAHVEACDVHATPAGGVGALAYGRTEYAPVTAAREALAAQPDDADAWRDAARDEYATDELAIYDDARVDVVDGGAWVEAWAWVARGDA